MPSRVPGAPTTPAPPTESLQEAIGHYAEKDHDYVSAQELARRTAAEARFKEEYARDNRGDAPTHEQLEAFRLGDTYKPDGSRPAPEEMPLGDLSSPEGRIKALDKVTQQSVNDASGEEHCGPASIVGAILVADGPVGLEKLMDAVNERGSKETQAANAEAFKQLREKIAKGKPLTVGDMHMLQTKLYDTMKTDMEHEDPFGNSEQVGVRKETMKDFIEGNEYLKETFEKRHMHIVGIDNDGDGANNHAVLEIQNDRGTPTLVYDPYARQGGQVVTSKKDLERYNDAHRSDY